MTLPIKEPRVLVVQNGARHNYAIPRVLADLGILSGFYTDACGNSGLGRFISSFPFLNGISAALTRLIGRRVPDKVLPVTKTFPLSSSIDDLRAENDLKRTSPLLGNAMRRAGLRKSNLIYSSLGWSPEFLKYAKPQGVKILTEVYQCPLYDKIHYDESKLYPSWEDGDIIERSYKSKEEELGPCIYSDALVCPSFLVKNQLVGLGYFERQKIHVVPYGIGSDFFDVENIPVPGDVLFAGSCTLMKGIHFYAMAAEKVLQNSKNKKFLAVGHLPHSVGNQKLCKNLVFKGRLPRSEMRSLYQKADILVFPSLSDAFPAVILEAMAAGIPVICSPYCGDVVEHGISGFVVDPKDTDMLAALILQLTEDRELRARMSCAARNRAAQFTWDAFSIKLRAVISHLLSDSN